jgi:protein O-GlcNAc transferase
VDLETHAGKGRLGVFARRAAPVQLCWLAYAGTTGLSNMDYRVTDPYLDPPDSDLSVYAERSLRLADTFWCYDPRRTEPGVNPLPALRSGHITFGSLNNFVKVNREVIALWARVLLEMDQARLILHAPAGDVRRHAIDVFARHGVPSDRIEFLDRMPRTEYLEAYHRIDIGLDPFPYNGGTTSLDAFWMGVPVVTLRGASVMSRAGYCFAMNLGLEQLIARSEEEYVRIAASLGRNLTRLSELRLGLRSRMEASPLMDGPKFARSMEGLFRQAWEHWCTSSPTDGTTRHCPAAWRHEGTERPSGDVRRS